MNMDYCLSELKALLSIDSPSGFTDKAADYLIGELTALGYAPERTRKGGVFCCLGGEGSPLVLMAHVDTLGGMISTIKPNGRITITPIGGLRAENCEAENCRIYSRFSGVYSGTLQLCNASIHVNGSYGEKLRTFETTEVVLDEPVKSADDVRALGIETGDSSALTRAPSSRKAAISRAVSSMISSAPPCCLRSQRRSKTTTAL